jgi:hypothetical protein
MREAILSIISSNIRSVRFFLLWILLANLSFFFDYFIEFLNDFNSKFRFFLFVVVFFD